MIGFSPIAPIISELYSCSLILVDIQLLLYTILFIPANFLVIWILNKFNLRVCLTIGAILLMISAWIRLIIIDDRIGSGNFAVGATIGNVIGAFA